MSGFIIIAGKTEGFSYKDGYIVHVDSKDKVKEQVSVLILMGYKIFVISEVIERIDKFLESGALQ